MFISHKFLYDITIISGKYFHVKIIGQFKKCLEYIENEEYLWLYENTHNKFLLVAECV